MRANKSTQKKHIEHVETRSTRQFLVSPHWFSLIFIHRILRNLFWNYRKVSVSIKINAILFPQSVACCRYFPWHCVYIIINATECLVSIILKNASFLPSKYHSTINVPLHFNVMISWKPGKKSREQKNIINGLMLFVCQLYLSMIANSFMRIWNEIFSFCWQVLSTLNRLSCMQLLRIVWHTVDLPNTYYLHFSWSNNNGCCFRS